MIYRVELSQESRFKGLIEFYRLPVQSEEDYRCDPRDLLVFEDVQRLSQSLRQLPTVYWGTIGKYQWEEQQQPD